MPSSSATSWGQETEAARQTAHEQQGTPSGKRARAHHFSWGAVFAPPRNMTVVPRSPYSLNLASCEFFLFSKVKIKLRGAEIWHGRRDPDWIVEGVEDADTKGLRGQLQVVAEMLGSLCAIAGALLRSGRCRLRLWVRLLSSSLIHFRNLRITDRRMSQIINFLRSTDEHVVGYIIWHFFLHLF